MEGAAEKNENSTIKPLPGGGQRKKYRKIAKRDRNYKLLSTTSVPCIKIQGGHGPSPPPAADTHVRWYTFQSSEEPGLVDGSQLAVLRFLLIFEQLTYTLS